MKKSLLLLPFLWFALLASAQAPQAFNYQGIARDLSGIPMPNQSISLRVSILSSAPDGALAFSETHAVTTNQHGLFSLFIGNGALLVGQFEDILWGSDDHFIQIEMDESGGNNYQLLGTSQLLSVPYAMYAEHANVKLGKGLTMSNDSVAAMVESPIWNSGQLQGMMVSSATPSQGDFLMYDDGKWIPHKPTDAVVPTGTCINSTNIEPPACYTYSGNSFVTTLTNPEGIWTSKSPLPTALNGMSTAVLDGKLYILGGNLGNSTYTDEVHIYDPATDTWSMGTPIGSGPRAGATTAVVDGKIYLIGGRNPSTTDLTEVYDPITDTWTVKADMPHRRYGLFSSTAVVDGKIYVIGGYNDGFSWEDYNEVYDPQTDSWETRAPMPTSRANAPAVALDGKIYVIGGGNAPDTHLATVEVYDPASNTWTSAASLPGVRTGHACVVLDGKIYTIGGFTDGQSLDDTYVFDPQSNTWVTKASMITPRHYGGIGLIDEKIYVVGGTTTDDVINQNVLVNEEYNPNGLISTTYYIHCVE